MLSGSNQNEAALYYLFMMADGEVSYSEQEIFDEICQKLNLNTEAKDKVIETCKGLAGSTTETFRIIVKEKVDEKAGQGRFGELLDGSSLARIVWNLINLGYADTVYSKEEKKIVDYLTDKWNISPEVYQEFIDTADTMAALIKYEDWTQSTFPRGKIRHEKKKSIDAEMKRLLDDVNLTIEEITM